MPILGTIASSFRSAPPTSYESIATVTLGTSASSINFTGIPNTYQHLQVRYIARMGGGNDLDIRVQYNDDTSASYQSTRFYGEGGGGVDLDGQTSNQNNAMLFGRTASSAANDFAPNVATILDYARTDKLKTSINYFGRTNSTTANDGFWMMTNAVWYKTDAITKITLTLHTGQPFAANTSVALYGMKVAA